MARRLFASLAILALSVGFAACTGAGAGNGGAATHANDGPPRVTLETADAKEKLGEDDGFDIAIFYGAELMGSIDDCGCPSHPEGGLPWRLGYTEGFRAAYSGAGYLQVDAGHSMTDLVNIEGALYPDQVAKSEWVLKALDRFHFDAVNISHHEAYYLKDILREETYNQKVAEYPALARFVSANLKPAMAGGAPVKPGLVAPPPYVVSEVTGERIPGGSARIAFIGLTENNPALPAQTGFSVVDAGTALGEVLPKARAESQVVAVLYYGAPEAAEALVDQYPGQIDVMIVAHPRARESEPKMEGETRTVYARYQTRKLGEVRLFFDGNKLANVTNRYVTLDDKLPKDPIAEGMAAEAKEAIRKAQLERFNASVPEPGAPADGGDAADGGDK